MIMNGSFFGFTGKWWQSRTVWATVAAFLFQQASALFPNNPWLPIIRDGGAVAAAVFLRLGWLNDRDYLANIKPPVSD
jgi:hypothetical protein